MRLEGKVMRSGFAWLALAVLTAPAQVIVGPRWYRSANDMLGRPAGGISAREVQRLERYLTFGVPYCGSLSARDYASNQEVARRMATYLANVGATATDLEARAAAIRVAGAFSAFPCAYPGANPGKELPVEVPPPQPGDPPFPLKAPGVGKVPDEQQETAADLLVRYDTDAARSAATWKNAEALRVSLADRGMSLNATTAAAVGRLQLLYEEAATAIKEHNWAEALSNLQAAEATTQKVASSVGR
jgi:hypothetical protein